MTGGFRVREQKFICGMNYATAPSMQVDFFEVTEQQHKASTRKKISIHALREEGDSKNRDKISIFKQIIQHSARI